MLLAVAMGILHGWPEAEDPEAAAFAVTLEEVAEMGEVIWVDGRTEELFAAGHAPGALLLRFESWEEGFLQLIMEWDGQSPIVVYCDGGGCEASKEMAERLRAELDFAAVYWLVDGWTALEAGGAHP